jgi:peptidyl-prolyl cis-trans isomerase B (cyclophilin B)
MSLRYKPRTISVGFALFLAIAGCNRGGDGNSAAIGGPNGSPAAGGGGVAQKPASDPQHPVVVIETELGNITVELDANKAPLTVENFLRYVNAGQYDQTIVHQVYKGQGFLAGGYDVNLVERPRKTPVLNEARNGLKNQRGTIAMVRVPDAIDSATCQFFINVSENPALDYKDRTPEGYGYCVFGEVKDGLAVVDKIGSTSVHDTKEFESTPVQPIIVKSVRQVR